MVRSRPIRPLSQGDLDGLCGIYAIINAIRLVYRRRFNDQKQEDLFEYLTDYAIKEQGNLRLLNDGIGLRHMQQLLNVGIEYLSEDLNIDVEVARPWRKISTPLPCDWQIDSLLADPKVSIIIGLERPTFHWTVISGCSEQEYIVFDSGDLEPIPFIQTAFTRKQNPLFDEDYIISASSIFVVKKAKRELG